MIANITEHADLGQLVKLPLLRMYLAAAQPDK